MDLRSQNKYPRILILAQIPPPYHGQAVMQKFLVDAKWTWCQKSFLRMEFSDSIERIGKLSTGKILSLVKFILKLLFKLIFNNYDLVYYPPCGPQRIPFYRDVIIIFCLKLFVPKIVFHHHAGGFHLLQSILSENERVIAKYIYKNIDTCITLLPTLENESAWIKPKRIISIPNGIEDQSLVYKKKIYEIPTILFVGNLREEKGIFDILEACTFLRASNYKFNFRFIGGWHNDKVRIQSMQYLNTHSLQKIVFFAGEKNGPLLWEEYAKADIFCLPTFTTEAMPLTILEAMMMGLPIVATRWRGLPDLIDDGVEGYLVPIRKPDEIAQAIIKLLGDHEMKKLMGKNGRRKYEEKYTIAKHLEKLELTLKEISITDQQKYVN